MLLSALSFTALAADPEQPTYLISAEYDSTTSTFNVNLYVSGMDGILGGMFGLGFDTNLLTLLDKTGADLPDSIPDDDYQGMINRVVGAGSKIMISTSNAPSKVISPESGHVLFEWAPDQQTPQIDAADQRQLVGSLKFKLNTGVDTADFQDGMFTVASVDGLDVAGWTAGAMIIKKETPNVSTYYFLEDETNQCSVDKKFYGVDVEATQHEVNLVIFGSDGKKVSSAVVKFADGSSYVTNANGEITLTLADGMYDFTVEVDGIELAQLSIIVNGAPVEKDVYLDHTVVLGPEAVTAKVKAGDQQVTVTWTAPKSEVPIEKYSIYYYDKDGHLIDIVENISKTTRSRTISGLTNGVTYTFTVAAIDEDGNIGPAAPEYGTQATPKKSGGGGDDETGGILIPPFLQSYTVTYSAGDGTLVGKKTETVKYGEHPVKIPEVVPPEGYIFKGWSKNGSKVIDVSKLEIDRDTKLTAVYEIADSTNTHNAYVNGYPGDVFLPNNNITRAEAAALIARVSDDFDANAVYPIDLTDVSADEWYANYVGYGVGKGMIRGYEDNTFHPANNITRAEFATLVSRMLGLQPDTAAPRFTDVGADHWAYGAINAMCKIGLINGYEDFSFRPDQFITRAEAIKILNHAIGRAPNAERIDAYLLSNDNPFTDVADDFWAFYEILEAAITHGITAFHN